MRAGEICPRCDGQHLGRSTKSSVCGKCCAEKRIKKILGDPCSKCRRTDVEFSKRESQCKSCERELRRQKRTKQLGEPCSKCGRCDVEFFRRASACKGCSMRLLRNIERKSKGEPCRKCRRTDVDFRIGSGQCDDCIARRRFEWRLERQYGLTLRRFDEMYLAQRGACAACRIPLEYRSFYGGKYSGMGRHPCVDHCHETGIVRGLLCHWCNSSVNKHMTPAALRGCADYLEKWQRRSATPVASSHKPVRARRSTHPFLPGLDTVVV